MIISSAECLKALMFQLGGEFSDKATCIGYVRDGNLKAGAIYDRWNGVTIQMSIWVKGRPDWEFAWAMFDYPFNQIGARKIVGFIYSDNEKSIKLAEHAGFIREATVKDFCEQGDMHVYTMTREQCYVLNRRAA